MFLAKRSRRIDGRRRLATTHTVHVKIGERFERVGGFTDQAASAELGRRVQRLADLLAAGEQPDLPLVRWLEALPLKIKSRLERLGLLSGRAASARRKIGEHVADYVQALRDGVASSRQHRPMKSGDAALVEARLGKLIAGIGAKTLGDVSAESVGRWLQSQKASGAMSTQTLNHYIAHGKALFAWLIRAKRTDANPLAHVGKAQVTPKLRTMTRRAMTADEAVALLAAAKAGPVRYYTDGLARYWLYKLAIETALRQGELRALTPRSFDLSAGDPCVRLAGDDTKNGHDAELPIRPQTARELARYLKGKPADDPLFATLPPKTHVARMFRADLQAARNAWLADAPSEAERTKREKSTHLLPADESGAVLDFHALRVTAITWLASAGVSVKTLQTFARHSTPVLTMNTYARVVHGSLADAAARLPDLTPKPATQTQSGKRSGTYDAPVDSGAQESLSVGIQIGINSVQSGATPGDSVRLGIVNGRNGDSDANAAKQGISSALKRTKRNGEGGIRTHVGQSPNRFSRPVRDDSNLLNPQALTESAIARWQTDWHKRLADDAELAAVLGAWDSLPTALRARIAGMVEAAALIGDGDGDGTDGGKR